MTRILTQADLDELYEQAPEPQFDTLVLDEFEEIATVPKSLGRGFFRGIDLLPGVWLSFSACEYNQDLMVKASAHDHLIQISIFLSGSLHCSIHPSLGGTRGYFSGSGISPAYTERYYAGERFTCVNVDFEPDVLESFFLGDRQRDSEPMQQLFKGEDWKVSFYPTVTAKVRSIAQQLWDAPYRGVSRRMYLQAKVFELLAMQLDLISGDSAQAAYAPGLKPDTIARLHYAKEILATQFENPPSMMELAQQVGVSDRTLQRGFRELFNTTAFGYLHNLRLEQAEQLLRNRKMRVSEVAHAVGYGHLGHFTEAFKRRFGMTPKQCQTGKVNALN